MEEHSWRTTQTLNKIIFVLLYKILGSLFANCLNILQIKKEIKDSMTHVSIEVN